MNTKHTRQMNRIRRALGISASVSYTHLKNSKQ